MAGRLTTAMAWYQRCLSLDPHYPDVNTNVAAIFKAQARHLEAAAALRAALRIQPADALSSVNLAFLEQSQVQWRSRRAAKRRIREIIEEALAGPPESGEDFPITTIDLAYTVLESPIQALAAARIEARYVSHLAANFQGRRSAAVGGGQGHAFRVGYISSDIKTHAVGIAMRGVLRHHAMAVSLFRLEASPQDDPIWAECSAYPHVTTSPVLQGMALPEALAAVEAGGVQVLINLNGNTEGSRNEIAAGVRVPVQLHFLGSPASLGLSSVPYITGDPASLPPHVALSHYAERVAWLPFSHHPSDSEGFRSLVQPSRTAEEESGGPRPVEGAPFTFASLNRLVKLDPTTLSAWIQAVMRVPGSRLCVVAPAEALPGLGQEATARGFPPASLQALRRVDRKKHLTRIRRGIDLALETRLVGGGSTVLDALWATAPIAMTSCGETMGSRFATAAAWAAGLRPSSACGGLKGLEDVAVALAAA